MSRATFLAFVIFALAVFVAGLASATTLSYTVTNLGGLTGNNVDWNQSMPSFQGWDLLPNGTVIGQAGNSYGYSYVWTPTSPNATTGTAAEKFPGGGTTAGNPTGNYYVRYNASSSVYEGTDLTFSDGTNFAYDTLSNYGTSADYSAYYQVATNPAVKCAGRAPILRPEPPRCPSKSGALVRAGPMGVACSTGRSEARTRRVPGRRSSAIPRTRAAGRRGSTSPPLPTTTACLGARTPLVKSSATTGPRLTIGRNPAARSICRPASVTLMAFPTMACTSRVRTRARSTEQSTVRLAG